MAPETGAGEDVANGAYVTGENGAAVIAGDRVNGVIVSLCTGDIVDPSGANVAKVGTLIGWETGPVTGAITGLAVIDPSGDPVVIGISVEGDDGTPTGSEELVGTVGMAGSGAGAVVLIKVVGLAVTVGAAE